MRRLAAVLAALLWLWGMSAPIAEAQRFGGFRGGRSFRRAPRAPSGFGGFRRAPRPTTPDSGFGGFRGPTRSPGDTGSGTRAAPSVESGPAPSATPRLGPAPAPAPTAPGREAPTSITAPLPGARPSAPEGPRGQTGPPTSITTPRPSAAPATPQSSGRRFSTRERPGAVTPVPSPGRLDRGGDYRRGWGGVYIPPGYGYWHVAPYHWLWWMGWANPYPASGPARHAPLALSILMTVLFAVVAIGVVAVIVLWVRRLVRSEPGGPIVNGIDRE